MARSLTGTGENIKAKQDAILELSQKMEWILTFRAIQSFSPLSQRSKNFLSGWIQDNKPDSVPASYPLLSKVLPLISILLAGLYAFNFIYNQVFTLAVLLILAIQGFFAFRAARDVYKRQDLINGSLSPINYQTSVGNSTCYVSVHSTGKYVAAGNYSSGNLVYYSANSDGSINPPINIKHEGFGPVKGRQDAPHVHSTVFSPDNKYLLVPDLGIDKVMIYPLDASGNIQSNKAGFVKLAPGSGPRHIEFHPNGKWAYLMEELSGNMTALSYAKGKLTVLNSVNGYPTDYKGPYGSADVHVSPDGKFVYGSNRGESNTMGIFKIDPKTGKIALVGTQSVLGLTPRNFNFDPTGNKLLVANQNSNEVVVFDVNRETGLLTDTGTRLSVSKPVCLKWIKK